MDDVLRRMRSRIWATMNCTPGYVLSSMAYHIFVPLIRQQYFRKYLPTL